MANGSTMERLSTHHQTIFMATTRLYYRDFVSISRYFRILDICYYRFYTRPRGVFPNTYLSHLVLYLVLCVREFLPFWVGVEYIEFLAKCLPIFWICRAKTRHRLQFYDTRSRLANETEVSRDNWNNFKYYLIISLLMDFLYIAKPEMRE